MFLDAFVVRLTLVPAVMAIVGSQALVPPAVVRQVRTRPDIEGERITHLVEEGSISAHTGYEHAPAPVG